MSALDQFTQALSVGCRLLWADSNRLERTIGIFGHQRLIAESYSLGGAQHMGFTDLVVHPTSSATALKPSASSVTNTLAPTLWCTGSLGYPFSNVTRSCDEPHERDAGLFHGRHHHHLQLLYY